MFIRNFSIFLAFRYLTPKRTFLSIITLISILGVMLGVTVLIVVTSVMTGFERELERMVVSFEAHVIIAGPKTLENWRDIKAKVEGFPEVIAIAPFLQSTVLAKSDYGQMVPKIRAIDPELEENVTNIKKFIIEGSYDLDGDKVIVGSELARMLGVAVGDRITLYAPGNIDKIVKIVKESDRLKKEAGKTPSSSTLDSAIIPADLEVTGIFESGHNAYDSDYLFVDLHIGQEIFDLGDAVQGLTIKVKDRYRAGETSEKINKIIDPPAQALTWIDLNKQSFDAIRMERCVMLFLLFFIVLVAAFGIMSTLITVTVQKTREIGVMKAVGARTIQIIGVFLAQGIVIGVLGALTGLLAGILLLQYRNQVSHWLSISLGVEVFPKSVYQFSGIPAEVVPSDVMIICIGAFLICSVAALIPAWFAARLDPVKALRYE